MKKLFSLLFAFFILFSFKANAQGIYQLWGMTPYGGHDFSGTMFSTDMDGNNFQLRHEFPNPNWGANPGLEQLIDYNGKLYGMARRGGSIGRNYHKNQAVIFEWDPVNYIYTKRITIDTSFGTYYSGSLTLSGGKFYGMTGNGGANGFGVIFVWDPVTNLILKKADFNGINGSNAIGSLTESSGKFYGMTQHGGSNNLGVIFEWDPLSNIITKKIDFNGTNGSNSKGTLTFYNGKFYGMTYDGGSNNLGLIFEWDPVSNIITKKYDLKTIDGSNPYGYMTLFGNKFYGMTSQGGNDNLGVIFEWDPFTNIYTKKIDFNNANGKSPGGSLTLNNGKFYGITQGGGNNGFGVIFNWDPVTNQYTKAFDFIGMIEGVGSSCSLSFNEGKFWGLGGGGHGIGTPEGVIFEWDPVMNLYQKRYDFNGISGVLPAGSFSLFDGKFYATASSGGRYNAGGIFEWDPSISRYKKRIDLLGSNGGNPQGDLTLNGEKFYGMTNKGGSNNMGVIFKWDPVTNVYTKMIDFNGADNGSYPKGSLKMNGGKFYGMTYFGGINDKGIIFEWDPVTNLLSKKVDLDSSNGSYPWGNLTFNNGKFYGMTEYGGANNSGIIFEWDPVSNIFVKKFDFNNTSGSYPRGDLTLKDGNFYGVIFRGGTFSAYPPKGVVFEWNPNTNVYTPKNYFINGTNHSSGTNSLTLSNGKFYGMLYGDGSEGSCGGFFEWEPVNNVYTYKHNFNTDWSGKWPSGDFRKLPAPVANGIAGNCTSFPDVTIDNSNNNVWVPIIDSYGDAVAEIKANGNNLGIVTTSAYINNGTIRENAGKMMYMDRNLTITPQLQPSSAVDIRLYIKGSEFLALKNGINSVGQPSGVNSIDAIGIFKTTSTCLSALTLIPVPVTTTTDTWQNDYVLSGSINSFSSFYFFNKAFGGPLPLTLLDFNGRLKNNNCEVFWKTTDELNTRSFDLERSTDGRLFSPIVNVVAFNQAGIHTYSYSDKNISSLGVPVIYYRLKQNDLNNRFTYSGIIAISIEKNSYVMLYPNPVSDRANITISINDPQIVEARIIDNAGKTIIQQVYKLFAGNNIVSIDVSMLARGMYYLELKGVMMNEQKKFMKF